MLKGEGLIYVRHEHRKGVSKDGNDYEFANVTLSDGLESFTLNIDFSILPMFDQFRKGEAIDITVDVDIGYNNRISLLITNAVISKQAKAG